jgi:succinate-acetate transporter protein
MPASDSAMGASTMGSDSPPGAMGGKMTSGWASPSILGLLVFGMMTIFFGLFMLPGPYSNGFVGAAHGLSTSIPALFVVAMAVGALLALVGIGLMLQGHLYWGSAFLGYGVFWGAFGWANHTVGFGGGYGMAAFMFLWLLFTLTFLISSIKHGWGTFIAFLFLFVGFILLTILFFQLGATPVPKISSGEDWAIGGEFIATGIIWWYGGTAQLTNHSFGKKIFPM